MILQNGYHLFAYFSYVAVPLITLLNFLPVFLIMMFFYSVTGRISVSFWLTGTPLALLLTVNHYKILFRDDPLKPTDLTLVKETANIMENYELTFEPVLIIMIVLFIALGIYITRVIKPKKHAPVFRIVCGIVSFVLLVCSYFTVYQNKAISKNIDGFANIYYEVDVSRNKGFIYYFLSSEFKNSFNPPEGYSKEAAENILARYEKSSSQEIPNVIAIMSESFSDLTTSAENLEFKKDTNPLQNIQRLREQGMYGELIVPGFAGATASAEFEYLSGANVSLIDRTMPDIYKKYVTQNMYGIPRYFKDAGYSALAIHPGHSWFYNRENVYRYMGFDDFITADELPDDVEKINYYISDSVTSQLICDNYKKHLSEAPGKPYFNFTVTIQNHGPYMDYETEREPILVRPQGIDDTLYNILNNYFLGLSDADRLLGEIADYIDTLNTPTIIVFFGDHLPYFDAEQQGYKAIGYNIDQSTPEGLINKFKTPYLIWGNTAFREQNTPPTGKRELISSNYLATEMFEYMGVTPPPYFAFLNELKHELPVIIGGKFYKDGEIVSSPGEKQQKLIDEYEILQYYILRDAVK